MSDALTLDLFAPVAAAPAPAVPSKRRRDVTVNGPNRYYLEASRSEEDRRRVIDRETGETVREGAWLYMWAHALKLNGLLDAPGPFRSE